MMDYRAETPRVGGSSCTEGNRMGTKSRRPPKDKEPAPPTPVPAGGLTDSETEPSLDDRLDEALEETFPASDPPAVHRLGRGHSYKRLYIQKRPRTAPFSPGQGVFGPN
jgi:hypothetical protein